MDFSWFFKTNLDIYIKIYILEHIEWNKVKFLCFISPEIRKIVNTVKYWNYKISSLFGKNILPINHGSSISCKKLYNIFKKAAQCQYDNGCFAPCRQYICKVTDPFINHPNNVVYCKVHLYPYCQYKFVKGIKKGKYCQKLVYKAIRSQSSIKGAYLYCYDHLNCKSVKILLEKYQ